MTAAAPDRRFAEAPVFGGLTATAFTFAFELEYRLANEAEGGRRHRRAFRLSALGEMLSGLRECAEEEQ